MLNLRAYIIWMLTAALLSTSAFAQDGQGARQGVGGDSAANDKESSTIGDPADYIDFELGKRIREEVKAGRIPAPAGRGSEGSSIWEGLRLQGTSVVEGEYYVGKTAATIRMLLDHPNLNLFAGPMSDILTGRQTLSRFQSCC